MSLLSASKLTVRFGGLTAVNEVDFEVKDREIFSIIGPNGAGKTTVFNAVTGIYEPTSGSVLLGRNELRRPFNARTAIGVAAIGILTSLAFAIAFNLEPLWDATITANFVYQQPFPWGEAWGDLFTFLRELPLRKLLMPILLGFVIGGAGSAVVWSRSRRVPNYVAERGIARTFQNIRLFSDMTVLENVLVGMDLRLSTRLWHMAFRLPRFWKESRQSTQRAFDLLRFVDLDGEALQLARNLPYGHQRRLEIARAMATEPKIILLDEPAAGMNPAETVELMELIRKIRDRGIAVVLIEHHMRVVMGISDRIVVLDYGNKIAEGTPDEIKQNPRVIEAYLGKEVIG